MKEQQGVPPAFPAIPKRSSLRQENASRHSAGTTSGMHPEDRPHLTDERQLPQRQRPAPVTSDREEDDVFPQTRTPSSVRRYRAPIQPTQINVHRIPARSSSTAQRPTPHEAPILHEETQRLHPTVFVGLALLLMIVGWVVLSTLGSWFQVTWDDWHYGRPRTFQIDAVVGHNDSAHQPSHFIALNLNGHIEVIELSGGDVTKAHIYTGPTLLGEKQNLAPVTLSFRDVTGDGKPDLIIETGESRLVYVNENSIFRPARPGEVAFIS